LERKQRNAKSYKIKKKHVDYVLKLLKKNPTWSVQLLWNSTKLKFTDFNITRRHLGQVIRDNNITRKRTTTRHFPETRYGKKIDLKKEMNKFYSIVDKYSITNIISIDETSIYAEMTSNYSRCELGKRCIKKTKNNKVFIKYTLVCAINSKGVVGWTLYKDGGMTSQRMIEFINKFISQKFKNNLIIMDNGGSHKSKKIKEKLNETGNSLQYSVPYKPKTNAIESWFNQFKYYFKLNSNVYDYDKLNSRVRKIIKAIPTKHYLNYMKYAYVQKNHRKFIIKESSRRRKIKTYKK
tara:strand:- start:906 stop:1787 length:882 start_codon:yes stop_codon:yes gene_type:complete